MRSPELVNMFVVPSAMSRHPEHERLNRALRRYVLAQEKSGAAANPQPLTQRNQATFESHFNLFRDADPAIQELRSFCWEQLAAFIGQLNGYDHQTLGRLQMANECWFHVTRRGGFFGVHLHPNASWSGVYCVDPGQHDVDKKDSGLLCFVNPMVASHMYLDAGNANLQLPYGFRSATLSLESGQLVIFPSFVLHDVKPFEGEGERITIAFNCTLRLPQESLVRTSTA